MIIISNIISFILISYIANSFLTLKYSKNKSIIILLLSTTIVCLTNYNGASPLKSIILLAIYFIYIFVQYNGRIIQKVMTILPYFLIQILSEILVAFCLNNILFIKITLDTSSRGFIFGTFFSYAILTLFVFIYVKILKYIKSEYLPKYTWLAFILPIITIILLVTMGDYFDLLHTNPQILITTVGLAISNIIFFFIFMLAINSTNMRHKLQIAKQKEELFNSKLDLLSQQYDNNFRFLHNLLHTCNQLNSLFNDSNYSEATNVLNKLSNTAYKEFNAIYSNSYILNYIINNNLSKIIENDIDIKTVIEYSDFDNLNYHTQLILFEYLINLAIDSCIQVTTSDKIIIIKSVKTANKIILKLLYSNVSFNKSNIEKNIKNILSNKYYSLSIKKINNTYISILVTFDTYS